MKSTGGEVVVFGDNCRDGFYSIPPNGLTLREIAKSAHVSTKVDRCVLLLRRAIDPLNCKFLIVRVEELEKNGNVALQPNDVIEVITAKIAR